MNKWKANYNNRSDEKAINFWGKFESIYIPGFPGRFLFFFAGFGFGVGFGFGCELGETKDCWLDETLPAWSPEADVRFDMFSSSTSGSTVCCWWIIGISPLLNTICGDCSWEKLFMLRLFIDIPLDAQRS